MEKALFEKEYLEGINNFSNFLSKKASESVYYRLYTTADRLKNNIENDCVYFSTGSNWNDVDDSFDFSNSNDNSTRFGLCLSCSKFESVAMWMLYGGKNADGIMINFGKNFSKDILNFEKLEIGYFENNKFCGETINLKRDEYKISFHTILYTNEEENGKYRIQSWNCSMKDVCSDFISEFSKKGYCKNIGWDYEREIRVVIDIDNKCLEKYEKEKRSTIKLKLSDGYYVKKIKSNSKLITVSPIADQRKIVKSLGNIKTSPSKYTGKINWNLNER